jgi:hypothetical protein
MLRDRKLTFPEAISFLKEMHERQVSLREVMGDHGKFLRGNKMMPRLGEFLVSADIVNANHVLIACEIGTEEDNNIGRVLMDRGHINEGTLTAALQLQEMIVNRVISYRRAVKLMRLSRELNAPIEQILEESVTLDHVFALLRRAGIVPERSGARCCLRDCRLSKTLWPKPCLPGVISTLCMLAWVLLA